MNLPDTLTRMAAAFFQGGEDYDLTGSWTTSTGENVVISGGYQNAWQAMSLLAAPTEGVKYKLRMIDPSIYEVTDVRNNTIALYDGQRSEGTRVHLLRKKTT